MDWGEWSMYAACVYSLRPTGGCGKSENKATPRRPDAYWVIREWWTNTLPSTYQIRKEKWRPCHVESTYDSRSAPPQCLRFNMGTCVSSRTEDGASIIALGYMAIKKPHTRAKVQAKTLLDYRRDICKSLCKATKLSINISHGTKK